MRKLKLILIITIVTIPTYAQSINEKDVPQKVNTSFSKMFPDAIVKNWSREGTAFKASFLSSGNSGSVLFTGDGKWIEYSTSILPENLPPVAKQYLKKNYKSSIKRAEKITNAIKQIQYVVTIDGKKIFFDKNGILLIKD